MYLFVIDTDTYAGNFCESLCACCLGIHGRIVGNDDWWKQVSEGLDAIITTKGDGDDTMLPYVFVSTPGWWNDGMGHCWPDSAKPTDSIVRRTYDASIAKVNWGQDGKPSGPPRMYKAYQSVGICLSAIPSPAIIALLCCRARIYVEEHGECRLLGFRLLRQEQVESLVAGYDANWGKVSSDGKEHSMPHVRFCHLYDTTGEHRRPVVTVCRIETDTGDYGYGWAICSDRDNPCKRTGRNIARGRAIAALQHKAWKWTGGPAWVYAPLVVRKEARVILRRCGMERFFTEHDIPSDVYMPSDIPRGRALLCQHVGVTFPVGKLLTSLPLRMQPVIHSEGA